jgi:hypothetical protein
MHRSGKPQVSTPVFRGLGEFEPPADAREPLVCFRAQYGLSFDAVVQRLEAGRGPIFICVMRIGDRIYRGRATEVDESGIVRVEPLIEAKHGVAFLLSKVEGKLHGEFAG